MLVLRISAYLLAIASFAIMVADGAQSIAAGQLVFTPLAAMWVMLGTDEVRIIAVSAGGGPLDGMWQIARTEAGRLPAAALALGFSVALAFIDAAMIASLQRIARSLRGF
jgi:hypothetical protein